MYFVVNCNIDIKYLERPIISNNISLPIQKLRKL